MPHSDRMSSADFEEDMTELLAFDSPDQPVLVVDARKGVQAFDHLKDQLPGFMLAYAVKAGPYPSLLKSLHEAGSVFDVASFSEVSLALTAGASSSDLWFSHPCRRPTDLVSSVASGCTRWAVDSLAELVKLKETFDQSSLHADPSVHELYVRLDVSGSSRDLHRFGLDPASALDLANEAERLGLKVTGASFYSATQNDDPVFWSQAFAVFADYQRLSSSHRRVSMLDIGGGFAFNTVPSAVSSRPSSPASFTAATQPCVSDDVLDAIMVGLDLCLYRPEILVAEPGRVIAAPSASLIAHVVGGAHKASQRIAVLDAGVYQGLPEMSAFSPSVALSVRAPASSSKLVDWLLVGPTCDSFDVLGHALLPESLAVGDPLVFCNAGAYSLSLATSFCGMPPPLLVERPVS